MYNIVVYAFTASVLCLYTCVSSFAYISCECGHTSYVLYCIANECVHTYSIYIYAHV